MGRRKGIAVGFLLVLLVCLSVACGKEEYVAEYGVDGYVYLSERIWPEGNIHDLRVVGDYLYFIQDDFDKSEIKRILIAGMEEDESGLGFSRAETLERFWNITFELPEGAGENEANVDFLSPLDGGSGVNVTSLAGREDLEKRYGRLMLTKYAVSADGNLYCYLDAYMGNYLSMDAAGGVLYRHSPDGGQAFRLYLPEMFDLAVDAEGRVLVLEGDNILVLDRDGKRIGEIPTDGYHMGGKLLEEGLFTDSKGGVYYTMVNEKYVRMTYGVEEFRLENAGGLLGEGYTGGKGYSAAPDGNVFQFGGWESFLYEYDRETGARREVLKWLESNLKSSGISSVVEVAPDILLVSYISDSAGVYRLARTPVEEVPEKELLVIAAPSASLELQEAVIGFNADSDSYRAIIDSYGAWFSDAEMSWMCSQLDTGLVSRNPPDMLALDLLNIPKYASRDILEDLSSYLEDSGVLKRGDIPDRLLEAMTYNGKLVCIPRAFRVYSIAARVSQTEDLGSWTMEDVYRLTEMHPESVGGAVYDGYGQWAQRDWLLEEFCAPYYLGEFVDWENWKCNFDSDGFRRLVDWAEKYGWTQDNAEKQATNSFGDNTYIPGNALLVSRIWLGFTSLMELGIQYGEEACLTGYPSSDGKGYFPTRLAGVLGITSNSAHKEGAWEFLEYYLQMDVESNILASKTKIRELYEEATTPEYRKGAGKEDGESGMMEKGSVSIESELIPYYVVPKEQADAVMEVIENADFRPRSEAEETIIKIIVEETESYYHGDKSLEEVTGIIQNRVQLLLNELRP